MSVSASLDERERAALELVAAGLERGDYVHVPRRGESPEGTRAFSMWAWGDTSADWSCNTAACIGGWVERETGVDLSMRERRGTALYDLLFDQVVVDHGPGCADAAVAIRRYLSGERDPWLVYKQRYGLVEGGA